MIVRPATREDIESFVDMSPVPTIKAWVGEVDGKIVGMAGVAFYRGRWFGFCDLKDEARKYKMTIARNAIKAMKKLKEQGIQFIYVDMDKNEKTSGRWLTSLGFELDQRSDYFYRWRA